MAGSEPGEGEGERGKGTAADCGEPPQPDRPGGDVGVADVDLREHRTVVGIFIGVTRGRARPIIAWWM